MSEYVEKPRKGIGHLLERGQAYLMSLPITVLLAVFFLFPLLIILLYSLSTMEDLAGFRPSLSNYVHVFATPAKMRMYLNSIIYSTGTVILLIGISLPIAYCLAKKFPRTIEGMLVALLIAPLFMCKLIQIFGWRQFFLRYGLFNELLTWLGLPRLEGITYTGPMALFGLAYLYFPFALFPIYISISNIDDSIINAARDLGAGFWRIMRDIIIGMSKPGIAIAAALTFSLSFGDSISSEILVGNNIQLVGNMEKFSFGHAQEWGIGSAESILTVLLLLAVIIPVLRKVDIQRLIAGNGQ